MVCCIKQQNLSESNSSQSSSETVSIPVINLAYILHGDSSYMIIMGILSLQSLITRELFNPPGFPMLIMSMYFLFFFN